MAVVQNIREKVHLPIYDSLHVAPGRQFRDVERSSKLKFFINVNNKTKLETNLQSASLLPHYNTFEARAMRVVISDLPPQGTEEIEVTVRGTVRATNARQVLLTNLKRALELLDRANATEARRTIVFVGPGGTEVSQGTTGAVETVLETEDIENAILTIGRPERVPPIEQIRSNNGSGNVISKLIFNTVTSLYVGEKLMIEMPTWFFPGGAGAYSESPSVITHGEPSPTATFRFAEPIYIDKQQNFRVEIEIPDAEILNDIQRLYGPLFIWVVLDGYMTRDVQ
jgi:hypothetical protein